MRKTFELGKVLITIKAATRLGITDMQTALERHKNCDWGNRMSDEAKAYNEHALATRDGTRIISFHRDTCGTEFWIISEADLSKTTILLPEDYYL